MKGIVKLGCITYLEDGSMYSGWVHNSLSLIHIFLQRRNKVNEFKNIVKSFMHKAYEQKLIILRIALLLQTMKVIRCYI